MNVQVAGAASYAAAVLLMSNADVRAKEGVLLWASRVKGTAEDDLLAETETGRALQRRAGRAAKQRAHTRLAVLVIALLQ